MGRARTSTVDVSLILTNQVQRRLLRVNVALLNDGFEREVSVLHEYPVYCALTPENDMSAHLKSDLTLATLRIVYCHFP